MAQTETALWGVVQEYLDSLPFPPSQAKLAERVGVARSAVSDWKLGRATPTPANMRALGELMMPQMGGDIFDRLVRAMNEDAGYVFHPHHGVAARDIGRRSRGQQRRDRANQAGEPPVDDPDDMEPR